MYLCQQRLVSLQLTTYKLVRKLACSSNNHAIAAVKFTFLLVSLSFLSSAERSSDDCFGSQKRRIQAGGAGTVQFLVHVRFNGRQPREEQIIGIVVRHAEC